MNKVYAGLEYGSTTFHLCGLNDKGQVIKEQTIPVTPNRQENKKRLQSHLKQLEGEVHLHHEACEMSEWFRDVLSPVVEEVYASDPLQNSWIARDPDKDDVLDARKLAELLRMDMFRRVYVSGYKHRREFKRIVVHRQQLVKKEVRMLNQIKAELRQQGHVVRASTRWPKSKRQKYMEKVPETIAAILRQKFDVLLSLRKNRKKAEKLMTTAARSYPEYEKLKEAPGVGEVCASRFIARIQDPHRFDNKRALQRYCCLAVVNQSSDGTPLGYEKLNKDGCTDLKDVSNIIFRSARSTSEPNGFNRYYRQSLDRTGDSTHARLNTQRKIVVTLWTLWKKDRTYSDEKVCES